MFFKASALSPQFLSQNVMVPAKECRKSACCPVCPIVWDMEGLTTDPGFPHHEMEKASPQTHFTGVIGRVGQAGLTPFLTYHTDLPVHLLSWVSAQQPLKVCPHPALLTSFIYDV